MAYDNTCKSLAQKHPADFVRWLLAIEATNVQVLKTELSLEPIRADSLSFLRLDNQILHIEFETLPYSDPPLPFRMLDYWVRLYRQYRCPIEQVIIFLQEIDSELVFQNEFEASNTRHRYRIIRMWEQDPAPFLANPALLPLATLAQTDSPQALLEQVAQQVARIESSDERQNILAYANILAGLRYKKDLIRQIFTKEIMKESVTYQAILEEGRQEGEARLIIRHIARRFGSLDSATQEQIQQLSSPQLEELDEAMFDFTEVSDLTAWLNRLGQ